MTQEDLEEWREHPVSRLIRDSLKHALEREKEAMTAAYWQGKAVPDEQRLGFLCKVALWEDLFEADLADFEAELMKGDDDQDV